MGGKVAAAAILVIWGVILADILIHPEGTKAAFGGVQKVLTPTYNALLGTTS